MGVEAEQFCAFVFEGDDLFDVFGIVEFVLPCFGGESAPHGFAVGAVIGILYEGDVAWVFQCEAPFACVAVFFSVERGGFDGGIGEAGELGFVFDDEFEGFGRFFSVVHEGRAEG